MGKMTTMLGAVAVLFVSQFVQAASVSYDTNFSQVVPVSPAVVVGTLPLFDPSLGTLTSVELTLDAEAGGGQVTWDNESAIVTDVELGIGAKVTATVSLGGLNALIATPVDISTDPAVDADNDGAPDYVGTDSFTAIGGVANDSDSDSSTSAPVLATFTGLGTFDVSIESILRTTFSSSGGFGPTQSSPGNATGIVTVTYTYDEPTNPVIPVPAALPVGAAILGLIGLRRKLNR